MNMKKAAIRTETKHYVKVTFQDICAKLVLCCIIVCIRVPHPSISKNQVLTCWALIANFGSKLWRLQREGKERINNFKSTKRKKFRIQVLQSSSFGSSSSSSLSASFCEPLVFRQCLLRSSHNTLPTPPGLTDPFFINSANSSSVPSSNLPQ